MTALLVRLQNTIADREERGAAMAEYGLLLALVALAAIVVIASIRRQHHRRIPIS